MEKHGILKGNIHYWQSKPKQWLLSFEDTKQLLNFESLDDMVNWLYFNNYKEQARSLNKKKWSN